MYVFFFTKSYLRLIGIESLLVTNDFLWAAMDAMAAMGHFGLLWATMCHYGCYGPQWAAMSTMACYGLLWVIWMLWTTLGLLWATLGFYEPAMGHFGLLWATMGCYGLLWATMGAMGHNGLL